MPELEPDFDQEEHEQNVKDTLDFLDPKAGNRRKIYNSGDEAGEKRPLRTTVEVGPKRRAPSASDGPQSAPGIEVITGEDDGSVTRHGGWTTLTPGKSKGGIADAKGR